MRYNVTFNQLELMRYNEGKPKEKHLNIIDAILLQQLYHLSKWENVETKKYKSEVYFWVAYGKIINELPSLGITTNNGLSKRIKSNLINPGLIKRFIDWHDNSKTYWCFTPEGLKIANPGRMEESPRTNGRETPGQTEERPPDERKGNYNTIDHISNDKRETLSHFDFLKFNYSEKINTWTKDYGNKIFNKTEFIKAFNNQMELDNYEKSKKLWNRFYNYSRQWIRNQKESERPEVVPPYLRTKIS